MIKIRISGNKKSTDAFLDLMNDLVLKGVFAGDLKDKEYENLDGTIRRYFDVDFLKPVDKKQVSGFFSVSARISANNLDEVASALNVFTNIAKVYYMSKTNGLDVRKRKGSYTAMVSIMTEAEAAKRITMKSMSDNLKAL